MQNKSKRIFFVSLVISAIFCFSVLSFADEGKPNPRGKRWNTEDRIAKMKE